MPIIDVVPLDWFEVEKNRLGGKYTASGYTIRYIEGLWLLDFAGSSKSDWRFPTLELAQDAANAHHAAQVRSQVAGVMLTDDEAYDLMQVVLKTIGHGDTKAIAAVQAAIAALQVEE